MTTVVAIHQPMYLPYLGFFHKMLLADVFVLYDTADYTRDNFHNRNRIKTPRGAQWLTVPVRRTGPRPIRDVEIDPSRRWAARHWASLQASYARAPHFASFAGELRSVLERPWNRLADLNESFIHTIATRLDIRPKILRSSALDLPEGLTPSDRLVEIVRRVAGDVYVSGVGGLDYLDPSAFRGVGLRLQDFRHPEYPQLWGPFLTDLSTVDLLLNVGPEARGFLEVSGGTRPWPNSA